MGKYIRIFIVIITVLGFAILAKSNAAWAASASAEAAQSVLAQDDQSVSQGRDDDCDKDNNKNKDKCKDKKDKCDNDKDKKKNECCGKDEDKDKDKCCGKDKDKDKCDDDDGTVKPPDDDDDFCERGDFSVGGVATLQVQNLRDDDDDDDCVKGRSQSSSTLLGSPSSGNVLSDALVLQLPAGTKTKICFAVPPGKQVKIYSAQGSWSALKTNIKNGAACAEVSSTGTYTLVGK